MKVESKVEVTHLITSLEVGGAQRMLLNLLERIDRERFGSRVVSLVGGGAMTERVRELRIPVCDLGLRSGVPDPRGIWRLKKLLARDRPHVLQTWLYHADILGSLAGRWARVPVLAWNLRHSFSPSASRGFAARIAPHLCARLSRMPDVVVTNSRAGQETHTAIGYRPREWELVPNGFDLSAFAPDEGARGALCGELGLAADTVVAGCVARWHPIKNIEGVLSASRALRAERPELHFVFAGEGLERSNPAFEGALTELGAADRVHALGPRDDVARLLAGMDFLILASSYEGFPNVLGEALACGTPCVTSPAGDAAEIVGDAGIVLPGADVDSLVEGVRTMSGLSAAERRRLGREGRERVTRRYDLEQVVRAYEALYERLSAPGGGARGKSARELRAV